MTVRGAADTAAGAAVVAATTTTTESIVPGRASTTAAAANGSCCGVGGERRRSSTRDPVGRENWKLAQHGVNNTAATEGCRVSSTGRCIAADILIKKERALKKLKRIL